MNLPKLYAIVDVACFAPPLRTTAAIVDYARDLAAGGATLIQYRNKVGTTREMLSHARELRRVLGKSVTLIMNDRADICLAAGYRGSARRAGRSLARRRAHGDRSRSHRSAFRPTISSNCKEADAGPADYIAFGPVFRHGVEAESAIPSSDSTAFAPPALPQRSRWSPSAASPARMRAR